MEKLKIKEGIRFEALKVTGEPSQFPELKDLCDDSIKISYEHATGIGYYWLIELEDDLAGKRVVVPDGHWILKIPGDRFTVIDQIDYKEFFEKVQE